MGRLEALFSASDTDGDGKMDTQEFTQMLNKVVDEGKFPRESLTPIA